MFYGDNGDIVEIGGEKFIVIETQDDSGGDYSWSTVALLRGENGQLYYLEDGGCSCNYFLSDTTSRDLTPVANWAAAVELVKADPPFMFSDNDVVSFAERLLALRPAPSPAGV